MKNNRDLCQTFVLEKQKHMGFSLNLHFFKAANINFLLC